MHAVGVGSAQPGGESPRFGAAVERVPADREAGVADRERFETGIAEHRGVLLADADGQRTRAGGQGQRVAGRGPGAGGPSPCASGHVPGAGGGSRHARQLQQDRKRKRAEDDQQPLHEAIV